MLDNDSDLAVKSVRIDSLRRGVPADLPALARLDSEAFPEDRLDLEPAKPGELQLALEHGAVWVLESHNELMAYIHAEVSPYGQIYISSLGVRPDHQGHRIGTRLMESWLSLLDTDVLIRIPIVTVTSLENTRMLKLIFAQGFVCPWILPEHFGSGRDRVGCQLVLNRPPFDVAMSIPAWDTESIGKMVGPDAHCIVGIRQEKQGESVFDLVPSKLLHLLPSEIPRPDMLPLPERTYESKNQISNRRSRPATPEF